MTFDIKPGNTGVEFKWEGLTITCDLPLGEMQLNTALEKWNMERVAKGFWNLNQNKINMAQGKMKISDIKANPNNPRIYEVKGYEGIYYASESGDIYSKNGKWNKGLNILKKGIDGSGYQIVTLCKDKKRTTKSVHRLVITAILGESELYVNHKNGIKTDNRLENLEWCTAKENTNHAIKNKLLVPNTKKIAEEKRKKVIQYDLMGNIINIFKSAHEASRITKFNRGNISTACRIGCMFYNSYWKYA